MKIVEIPHLDISGEDTLSISDVASIEHARQLAKQYLTVDGYHATYDSYTKKFWLKNNRKSTSRLV